MIETVHSVTCFTLLCTVITILLQHVLLSHKSNSSSRNISCYVSSFLIIISVRCYVNISCSKLMILEIMLSLACCQRVRAWSPAIRRPYTVSILSWNVNGIRSYLRHDPTASVMKSLITAHKPDYICLQETKLQEAHVDAVSSELTSLLDCKRAYFSCSRRRKGYSGTAVLVFNDQMKEKEVCYEIGDEEGDQEGRVIVLNTGDFALLNVYTPNSGESLDRLSYRVNAWDKAFRKKMDELSAQSRLRAVIVAGDLNVAHETIDFHCYDKPVSLKMPGTTLEERKSFRETILGTEFIDTFRAAHPGLVKYSYFSARSKRVSYPQKLGFRLDYILTNTAASSISKEHPPFIDDRVCSCCYFF
jgi:exodeoxyribonuclease-3